VDIPAAVGGPAAYVGFTAGTGALTDTQDVLRWAFSTTTPPANLDFSTGFGSTAGLAANGFGSAAALHGTALRLTDGGLYEARSVFSAAAVDVRSFRTSFAFTLGAGAYAADGFTFALQGAGPTALGAAGGGLGYAGLGRSVAVKFDLWDNSGEGPDSTGLYLNGAPPTVASSLDLRGSGIDLHSGRTYDATLAYDGATLTLSLADEADPSRSFSHAWAVDIPAAVGGPAAYVGFTAGTGALTDTQDVLRWVFTSTTPSARK
jgi:hypothetical protein